jgi:hypothetical protein
MSRDTLLIFAIAALLLFGGGSLVYDKTRGLRNNNPGNIRRGADDWMGLRATQTDESFLQFVAPEYGIRAMARILRNYASAGYDTAQEIISRWAPPIENKTGAYVAHVVNALNVPADARLDLSNPNTLAALIGVIIRHENGMQPYPASIIAKGIALA